MFLFGKVATISGRELQEKLASQPQIIDIRQKEAFIQGHISGASNVTMEKIDRFSQTKLDKEKPVYVVCYSGMSSKQAVKKLQGHGFQALSVKGGMGAWQGPLRKGVM